MADIEFRVVSDHREGLLLELGRVIIASGFTLQRQRMVRTDEGVVLTMVVRGPESNLLTLEDKLGSHPVVMSFEAAVLDAEQAQPVAAATARAPLPRLPLAAERGVETASASVTPDHARAEALLGSVAREYPVIFERVLSFEHALPVAQREVTTRYAGTRLGAWIYKRDYALGARLNLVESVKHIALPAMRHLLRDTELHGEDLRIARSPFAGAGLHRGASCHFLRGCLEGLLNEPGHLGRPRIVETHCRNAGAGACVFAFSD